MLIALVLFLLTYVFMLIFPKNKSYIALFSALVFIIFGILPFNKIFTAIDFNVLLMILGIMGTVSLFIESKMPNLMADLIIDKVPNVKWLTISLAVFSALVSAFVDNVATVLMIAPIVIVLSKKLKISPVPIIISVSIFSNLEGAATLVGDTTSILLAGQAKMDFLDFFFLNGKIGLFFIVQIGLLAATVVLYFLQRKNTAKINNDIKTKVNNYYSTVLICLTILTLIIASFFVNKPELTNGIICIFYFIIGIIIKLIKEKNLRSISSNIKEIDLETIVFLASLFLIIGGIKEAGVIDKISELFLSIGSSSPIVMYTLITIISVIVSAFIDNIPYVATMLPVVASISVSSGIDPILLYYGLIIGSTLGGNITPIGASANITAIRILNKNGYEIKNKNYFKYSVPISIVAILSGYLVPLFLYI